MAKRTWPDPIHKRFLELTRDKYDSVREGSPYPPSKAVIREVAREQIKQERNKGS